MPEINTTNIQSILRSLQKNWDDALLEGKLKTDAMIRVSNIHAWDGLRFIHGFAQPILGFFYLAFSIFVLFIFIKENMTGFVHCLLILSNFFTNLPNVLSAPVNFIFFNFANIEAPMPYPWCYIYVIVEQSLRPIFHATAIHLKILLAINRLCSVYYPFQTSIWFTKKRSFLYSFLTCFVSLSIGASLTFTFKRVSVVSYVDDIWGNGNIEGYDCCSEYSVQYSGNVLELYVLMPVIFSVSMILAVLVLIVCNFLLIVKIGIVKAERRKLKESRSPQMDSVENRMDLLSKVSSWILSAVIVTEMPSLVAQIMGLEHSFRIITYGTESINAKGSFYFFTRMVHLIATISLSPMDLVIFVLLSDKTRKAMKERLCGCKQSS